MLGTVLEKLQSLLPKQFFLANLTPVLIFILANSALLYVHDTGFRRIADQHFWDRGTENPIRNGTIFFLICFLVAFLFSMINTRLREILEGEYWPSWLGRSFIKTQYRRLSKLNGRLNEMQRSYRRIESSKALWEDQLLKARLAKPKRARYTYSETSDVARSIDALRRLREQGGVVSYDDLEAVVCDLSTELGKAVVSMKAREPNRRQVGILLDRDQNDLRELIDYALVRYRYELNQLFNERQFSFPDETVAPTAMGNIARSIGSYTESRYAFHFELLWSRLQKTMQAESFYATVQNAKTQLDFLVSTLWLAAVSFFGWFVYLLFGYDVQAFLLAAVIGPVLVAGLYLLCLQNYRAFADLLRSSVDLYRFELLKDLRIPYPEDSTQEKNLWKVMRKQLEYGDEITVTYADSE